MSEKMFINLFSEFIYIIAFVLLFIAPHSTYSWDIAVATDGAISLFDFDGNIESSPEETEEFTDLRALAFDSKHQRLFFSVIEYNTSIFALDLDNRTLSPIVPRQSHEVLGLAYDDATSTLYWTNGRGRSIWLKSLEEDGSSPKRLLYLEGEITTGITISFCKRLLFWTNSNHTSASIDSSNLDGTNHTRIITAHTYQPLGITVDEPYGKIYWTDDHEGIYYRIERSNLDGTDRELIIQRTHQQPFAIVATNNAIYWTDMVQKNVWVLSTDMSFPNHTKARLEPDVFHHYKNYDPNGIVAYSDGVFECNVVQPRISPPKPIESSEELEPIPDYCLNSGDLTTDGCKCRLGYSGERCEVYACHNFCLNGGSCATNADGLPECHCAHGYRGERCHLSVCEGFCLNGGTCRSNGSSVVCSCLGEFVGDRCDIPSALFCRGVCLESPQTTLCDCSSLSLASSDFLLMPDTSHCRDQRIIVIALVCFGATSMLVIAVLSRRICILRRRPRIKKRIIVNKPVKSQTPMTVRPHPLSSTEQCEITIENCCNMNICETPCFEPNLRSSRSTSSSLLKKTEDRKKLLKNAEEEFGELDDPYS